MPASPTIGSTSTCVRMTVVPCRIASSSARRARPAMSSTVNRRLARAVASVSSLALEAGIAEAEINPLLVKDKGVVAVDALVVRKEV